MSHQKLKNYSYVVIHSFYDSELTNKVRWLAECVMYPQCKGEGTDPNAALEALIKSISITISTQAEEHTKQ